MCIRECTGGPLKVVVDMEGSTGRVYAAPCYDIVRFSVFRGNPLPAVMCHVPALIEKSSRYISYGE